MHSDSILHYLLSLKDQAEVSLKVAPNINSIGTDLSELESLKVFTTHLVKSVSDLFSKDSLLSEISNSWSVINDTSISDESKSEELNQIEDSMVNIKSKLKEMQFRTVDLQNSIYLLAWRFFNYLGALKHAFISQLQKEKNRVPSKGRLLRLRKEIG